MKKKAAKCAAIALSVLLLASCARREKSPAGAEGKTAEEVMAMKYANQPTMIVDGVAYMRKPDVRTVLFMGIDKSGDLDTAKNDIGGQCDVLLLLVVDGDAKKQTILQIDRDTIAEVEVLDANGKQTGFMREQQICLSHSYGKGDGKSCDNTVRAVSHLLLDTPVDGYVSLLYDAIPGLNDELGGVEVKITDDFSVSDPTLVRGETVLLKGKQALTYVRGRSSVADGTNENRMGRQRTYLSALGGKLRAMMKTDASVVNDLLDTAKPYMITDMPLSELTSVAVEGAGYADGGILTPAGEHTEAVYPNGNTYVEFHAEEDSILENVLTLFYERVG